MRNTTFISGLLGAASVLALPATGYAQATSPDVTAAVEDVIVTGTRRAERTVSDSSVPVDVIGSEDLGSIVSNDLNDKLAQLVPSFNVQRLPGFDGANFVRPPLIRVLNRFTDSGDTTYHTS